MITPHEFKCLNKDRLTPIEKTIDEAILRAAKYRAPVEFQVLGTWHSEDLEEVLAKYTLVGWKWTRTKGGRIIMEAST